MSSNSFWYRQLPNLITSARIALVPLVLWLLLAYWDSWPHRLAALVIVIIAASTDGVDGAIARKRNLVSDLGKILDPIADKVLLSGSLIALSLLDAVPWLVTGLILIRELGITVYRMFALKTRVIAASNGGKFKTVMQIIAVCMAIAPFGFLGDWYGLVTLAVLWFTTAITIITGIQYLRPAK